MKLVINLLLLNRAGRVKILKFVFLFDYVSFVKDQLILFGTEGNLIKDSLYGLKFIYIWFVYFLY